MCPRMCPSGGIYKKSRGGARGMVSSLRSKVEK